MAHARALKTNDTEFILLCQELWSWSICAACVVSCRCPCEDCPIRRLKKLSPFCDWYNDLLATRIEHTDSSIPTPTVSHENLRRLIKKLSISADLTKNQLAYDFFVSESTGPAASFSEQEWMIDAALKILLMTLSFSGTQSTGRADDRRPWRGDMSLRSFLLNAFPVTDQPGLNAEDLEKSIDYKPFLAASRLQKLGRLHLIATDDLSDHLRLDRTRGLLFIFHHTSVLKEHLRFTRSLDIDADLVTSKQM